MARTIILVRVISDLDEVCYYIRLKYSIYAEKMNSQEIILHTNDKQKIKAIQNFIIGYDIGKNAH